MLWSNSHLGMFARLLFVCCFTRCWMEEPPLLAFDRCSDGQKYPRKRRGFQFPCTVFLFDDTKLKDTGGVRLLGVTQFLDCTDTDIELRLNKLFMLYWRRSCFLRTSEIAFQKTLNNFFCWANLPPGSTPQQLHHNSLFWCTAQIDPSHSQLHFFRSSCWQLNLSN